MQYKKRIILLFLLVLSIIFLAQSTSASTTKLDVYFEINGQTEFTKAFLDANYFNDAYDGDVVEADIFVVSTSGVNERLTNLQFDFAENDLLKRISYLTDVYDYTPFGGGRPEKWLDSGTLNNSVVLATSGGGDAVITTTPLRIATVYIQYDKNSTTTDIDIATSLTYASWNSGNTLYTTADLNVRSILVGDPNATPDATLASLGVVGNTTNTAYSFNVNTPEVAGVIKNQITIKHQDSISGLTITPTFTKLSLDADNYTITYNKAGANYQTGDTINVVTTDGVETKTYQIELIVEAPGGNTSISLTVKSGDFGTITFNSTLQRYEVVTPFTETDLTINATTADPYATLDKTFIRSTNLVQDEFVLLGTFNVTAENGITKAAYPVYAFRTKGSSDALIKVATNEFPTGLTHTDNEFIFNYGADKTSLSFQILKNQSGQTISYKEVGSSSYIPYVSGAITKSDLQTGVTYSYEIKVVPESKFEDETEIYIVKFIVAESSDTTLNTVKVQESGYQQLSLNVNNLVYTVVNNQSSKVTLTLEPGIHKEVKIGSGSFQAVQLVYDIDVSTLVYGDNNLIVTVKAQDGTLQEYTIKIVKKSDQANIDSILFRLSNGTVIANLEDFTFIPLENKYTYAFDYGLFTNVNDLKLELTSSSKSTINSTTVNSMLQTLDFSGTGELTRTISLQVTSENKGVTNNYTIQITRNQADNHNDVSAINIGGLPFSQFKVGDFNVNYNKLVLEPAGGVTSINFEVILPLDSKATVKIGSQTFTKVESGRYGTNINFTRGIEQIVTITITAQNGDTNILKIPFVVATNDSILKTLEVEGTDFVFDKTIFSNTININYGFSSNVKITASANSVDSKVYIAGLVRENDTYIMAVGSSTTTFKVWVVSEAGTKGSEYTVNIVRALPKTHNLLESLVIRTKDGQAIDFGFLSSQKSYTLRMDDYDSLWPLTYSASVDAANYSYIGSKGTTNLNDQMFNLNSSGNGTITIHVYSESGVLNTYTINIKRANDIKTFESVTISGTGFATKTYMASEFISGVLDIGNILYNVDRLNVTFNMVDGSKSTIASTFIGNATTGTWLFNSSTGMIEGQFRVVSQASNYSEYFKIKVNRQVPSSQKNLSLLEVMVGGENILTNFSSLTNTYILRVDRNVSSVIINAFVLTADRSSVSSPFNLDGTVGLNQRYTYTYDLNDPAALASNVLDIIVKAEDGTSKTYKVTIWRKNIDIDIDEITFKNGSEVIYQGAIDSVPHLGVFENSANELTVFVTPSDRYARISFNGGSVVVPDEFGVVKFTYPLTVGVNQALSLKIQSDLLSTEISSLSKSASYTFNYTKKPASNLAELDALEINVGGKDLLEGVFTPGVIRYEGDYLRVDRTYASVEIFGVAKEFGTVTGLGVKEIKPGQINSYTITVKSQSGAYSKDYTVYIVSKNDNYEINTIKVNNQDIGFVDTTLSYTLDDVLYQVSSLPILVSLKDAYASYYVNGVKNATSVNLNYGDNVIEIYSESEYGTDSTLLFEIHVFRISPYTDTSLSQLTVKDKSNNQVITHTFDGSNYLVQLPDQSTTSSVQLDIVLKNIDKQILESVTDLSNIILSYNPDGGLDQTIEFTVKAEDNNSKVYRVRFTKNVKLSSDFGLSNVVIKNQDNQLINFSLADLKANHTLTIDLGYGVKSLNIEVIAAHLKASVSPNKLNNIVLTVGENTFEFIVIAEDGTKSDPYVLTINRASASKDITLSDLTVTDPLDLGKNLLGLTNLSSNGLIYNPLTKTYNYKLDESYIDQEIIINFVKNHVAQTITGPVNAPLTLVHGLNRFEVFVKAEDETVTQGKYTIIIEVKYKSNSLKSLTIDSKIVTINDLVTFDTEKESVVITPVLESPTFGSYEVKNSLGVVVSNTLNLNIGLNTYTIDIKNEYGTVIKTHTVEITRNQSSEKTITNVSLIGSNGTNYLTDFNVSKTSYTINLNQTVEYVTLSATIPAKATAIGLGKHTINLNETITVIFQVIAEDGTTTDEYEFIINRRALSTNNQLQEISILDTVDPTKYLLGLDSKDTEIIFNKDTKNYTINLGLEYVTNNSFRNLVIRYVKDDPYQVVDKSNPSTLRLERGVNTFVITVLAEDSLNTQPYIYTLTINVLNETNDLKELKIDNQIVPIIDNQISFVTEKEQVNLVYTPLNTDGSVILKDSNGNIISNLVDLVLGDNTVFIEIKNEFDQIVETYEVIITRNESSDITFTATLKDTLLNDYLGFDPLKQTYNILVPYEVSSVILNIVSNPKATAFGNGTYNLVSGNVTTITFYVQAENGDLSLTYQVNVTRAYNSEDKLKGFSIVTNIQSLLLNQDFDPENDLYTYQVNETHTHVTFGYIKNDGQTVSGVAFNVQISLVHGLNSFSIIVQPEDSSLEPFIIRVEITRMNSKIDLESLSVDGVDIYQTNQTEYQLDDVSSDKKSLDISALLSDVFGTLKINNELVDEKTINLIPGENIITIEITSEDLSTVKTFTIRVNQLLEETNTLEELSVITNNFDYLLGNSTKNPIIVFNPNTTTYKFSVNEDIETIFVDFIKASNKQTISGPWNEYLTLTHGMNRFEFVVTPEDPNKQSMTYVIEVTLVYEEIIMDQLLVNTVDIYVDGIFSYVLDSVTNDIKTLKVIPVLSNNGTYQIFDTKNTLISGNDVPLYLGINTIKVTATSENGLEKLDYLIVIEQTFSNDNEIIDARFFDAATNINRLNFDKELTNYDIEFPATTNIARLRVETHNKAVVYINGVKEINTRKDFNLVAGNTITVKFYVVAEDGTKGTEYTINVYKRLASDQVLSDNTNLINVTIEVPIDQVIFDFDPSIYEYTIRIPYQYAEIYIKAHTESKGATVLNEGAYALSEGISKVIRLRVTAEDGTVAQREYKFTITRDLPNDDTRLKSLVIKDLNGNVLNFDQAMFDQDNRIYNITLEESTKISLVNVVAEKNHETQKLYNVGIVKLHGEIEGYYNTIITVSVESESGLVGEYIIYILHDLDFAGLAEVKDISIIGDNGISYFGLEFVNDVYSYDDIVVPFNVSTTRLIVQTIGNIIYLNSLDEVITDNRIQSFDSQNLITYRFKIESTNGQNESEIYEITVRREQADSNSLLDSLDINGEMIKGFNPNIFEYNYIHPLQFENFIEIYGVSASLNSVVKGNDVYTLLEGQTRSIQIEVTAQSGDKSIYTIHVSYVNSNALLGQLIVYEMVGDKELEKIIPLKDDTLNYIVIIGKQTNYVNIKGFAKDQGGASIRGFGIREVGNEDQTIEIIVTSGDGFEQITYLITLRRDTSLSNLKEITLLQVNDKDVVRNDGDDPYVYKYNLSRDVDAIKLSAITNNNAKVSINGHEFSSNNMGEIILTDIAESQVIKIAVQAEDGSIQHYMVLIQKEQQPNMLLTILLILSIILWVITAMILILKKIRKNNKKDKNQLIF